MNVILILMKTINPTTAIAKITLLVGLPGSGKSTLGNILAKESDSYFLDDISNQTSDINLFFADFFQTHQNIQHLIVSDVYFCYEKILKKAQDILNNHFPNAIIDVIYFENSYQKCLNNINYRISLGDDRKVLEFLSNTSKIYTIPSHIQPVSIWQHPTNQFKPK